MNQVAGKFAFLKPVEELRIWYGIVVSLWQIEFKTALLASVCELTKLSMAQATTITYGVKTGVSYTDLIWELLFFYKAQRSEMLFGFVKNCFKVFLSF